MHILRQRIGVISLIAVLVVSLAVISAAKFDTADRIWLVLFLGSAAIFMPIFFGTAGIKKHPWQSLFLILWLIFVWLSLLFSKTANYGFSEAVGFSLAGFAALGVSAFDEKSKRALVYSILFLAVVSSLFGFWYFPTHGETRMAGLFLDWSDYRHFFPNAFANFILLAWPLVFLCKNFWKGRGKILLNAILLAALYLTYSRGAWAAFIIEAVALGAFVVKNKMNYKNLAKNIIFSLALTAIIVGALLQIRAVKFQNISLANKITFQNEEAATSISERKDFWLGSLKLIAENPVFGSGPMSFRYVYPPLQKNFLAISDHPHNWFLKTGVESGLPAALALIAFLALVFAHIIKQKTKFSNLIGVALLGGLLHNMVDYNLNFLPILLAFFLLAGISLSENEKNRANGCGKILATIFIFFAAAISFIDLREIYFTMALQKNPENPAYQNSLSIRDYYLKKRDEKSLAIQIQKNPYDAYAQYLAGNYLRALELDPMNHFSYYRAVLQTSNEIPQPYADLLKKLLSDYDNLLKNDIHYTAFTANPEEAAKIYELEGNPEKAAKIRSETESIRQNFLKKQQ